MKKVIRLTERDLTRIVKRVIRESEDPFGSAFDMEDNVADYIHQIRNVFREVRRIEDMSLAKKYDIYAAETEEILNQAMDNLSPMEYNEVTSFWAKISTQLDRG